MIKRFEQIEHTADICVKIYGKNLRELFNNAAVGLCSLLSDVKKVKARSTYEIDLRAKNKEELFIAWLNEIIFHFSTHEFIPKKCTIHTISSTNIKATLFGEKFTPVRHRIFPEIKAATYHELSIAETKQGFEARVIFDT